MKTYLTRSIIAALASVVITCAASALVLGPSNLVGNWNPGSDYNTASDAKIASQALVTWYNGGTNANTLPGDTLFTLAPTSLGALPPTVPDGTKVDTSGPVDFNGSLTTYLVGKYGNVAYLFYLGGSGTWTLPSKLEGVQQGLSHYVAFGRTSVPDGGSTIALLGLGLALLAIARRKLA